MANNPRITITVNLLPHPNPEDAIKLIAGIVVKELLNQEKVS